MTYDQKRIFKIKKVLSVRECMRYKNYPKSHEMSPPIWCLFSSYSKLHSLIN